MMLTEEWEQKKKKLKEEWCGCSSVTSYDGLCGFCRGMRYTEEYFTKKGGGNSSQA